MPRRFLCVVLLLATCTVLAGEREGKRPADPRHDPRLAPLPAAAPAPDDNPTTPAKVALGKQLFFDPRLSGGNTMSCASCHIPQRMFADGTDWNKGERGISLNRNTQSCLNVGFYTSFFWDGRAASLEEQALAPIQADVEMNQNLDELERELGAIPGYVEQFQNVFGARPNRRDVAKALAAYQRTLNTGGSPYDRYLLGDDKALSADAKRGLELFVGAARCIECHNGPLLSDGKYHRTGAADDEDGRYKVTGESDDLYRFRTPSLRNVAQTAPYMHNGLFATLDGVLSFYYNGPRPPTEHGPPIEAPDLQHRDLADIDYLLAFLNSLTGDLPDVTPPDLPPGAK